MTGWIASRAGMLAAAVLAGLTLLLALLGGARRAGRQMAEQETLKRTMEAHHAADRAGAAYRADGAERRLRDGTF